MLTFLKKDTKDEARLQKKRLLEEERKKRIFNPRTRLIGVDIKAWEEQLQEKESQRVREQILEQQYTIRRWSAEKEAISKDQKYANSCRQLKKQINQFREQYQKREDAREFDLNRPDYVKQQTVGRLRLLGEDETYLARRNYQKEEQKAWLLQQVAEKKAEQEAAAVAMKEIARYQEEKDFRAVQLAELEKELRQKAEEGRKHFNILQKKESETNRIAERKEQHIEESVEINNWVQGSLLSEDPNIAKSAFGPGRIRPECYKGACPDDRLQVRRYQLQQVQEIMVNREKEKADNERWAQLSIKNEQILLEKEREMEQRKKALQRHIAETNKAIASTRQDRELKGLVEPPSSSFFDKFNQSSY